MRKVLVSLALMVISSFAAGNSSAITYKKDVLEPGNPGGWTSSLKTFDTAISAIENETIFVDIWLSDLGSITELCSAGVWLDFSEYLDLLEIVSIKRYNNCTQGAESCYYGDELAGPWEAGGFVVIGPTSEVPEGKALLQTLNLDGAPKDGGGDIILARVELHCTGTGPAAGTAGTIPGYVTLPIDTDTDAVFDQEDNCANATNGPLAGTCVKAMNGVVMGTGVGCTSQIDCGTGETCQKAQGDINTNSIGDACECYANCNTDNKVDLADLVIMKQEFLKTPDHADCNNDGKIDLSDVVIMKFQFLKTGCPVGV